jgi:hypothetical protein
MKTKLMMFSFALAATFATAHSSTASAATFTQVRKLSNPTMQELYGVCDHFGEGSAFGAYRVTAPTDARGRSASALRLATLKQAIHAHFGADFSDALDLTREPHTLEGVKDAIRLLDVDHNDGGDQGRLQAALEHAISDRSIEIYAGKGAGNNTMGDLIGFYDIANDEVLYCGYSNFGSDN